MDKCSKLINGHEEVDGEATLSLLRGSKRTHRSPPTTKKNLPGLSILFCRTLQIMIFKKVFQRLYQGKITKKMYVHLLGG